MSKLPRVFSIKTLTKIRLFYYGGLKKIAILDDFTKIAILDDFTKIALLFIISILSIFFKRNFHDKKFKQNYARKFNKFLLNAFFYKNIILKILND